MVFGIKGPKELLSTAIANALAEFFEVDASKVESNLLKDAKIVLNQVKLRTQKKEFTQQLHQHGTKAVVVATTTGTVEQVTFSWAWSVGGDSDKKNTSNWVKDATLTIQGLQFKTQLSYGVYDKEGQLATTNNAAAEKATRILRERRKSKEKLEALKKEGKLEAYIRSEMEQIIDALTLRVTDFEFTLCLPSIASSDGAEISVGGHTVEVVSLGRLRDAQVGGKGSLQQQLTIGSFYMNTIISTTTTLESKTSFPLLSPMSYRAIMTRRSGKRFSSFGTGLEVIGEHLISTNKGQDSGVIFHAGTNQIEVLTQLGKMLLKSSSKPMEEEDKVAEQLESFKTAIDNAEALRIEVEDDSYESLKREILTSSIFVFPIIGISLVLPNETKCTLERFTIEFHADGKVMKLEGADGAGILVNDYEFLATNDGSIDSVKSRWQLDFISSTFLIGPSGSDDSNEVVGETTRIAFIQCRQDILRNIFDGMKQFKEATSDLAETATNSRNKKGVSVKTSPGSKWLVDIQKNVDLRLERALDDPTKKNEWLDMTIEASSMKLPFSASSEIKCKSLNIGPYSNGRFSFCVPTFYQRPGEMSVCMDGDIVFLIESSAIAREIKCLLTSFTQELHIPKKTVSTDLGSFKGLPISIEVPKIRMTIMKPSLQVDVIKVMVEKSTVEVSSISVHSAEGASSSILGIKATSDPQYLQLDVAMVESMKIPGVFSLSLPISNSEFVFQGGELSVKLSSVHGVRLAPKPALREQDERKRGSNTGIYLPFPVSLSIGEIGLNKEIPSKTTKENLKKSKKDNMNNPPKELLDHPFETGRGKSTREHKNLALVNCCKKSKNDQTTEIKKGNLEKSEKETPKKSVKVKTVLLARQLELTVKPSRSMELSDEPKKSSIIDVIVSAEEAQNMILQLTKARVSASINTKNLGEVKNLVFATDESIKIQAGHSTVEWSHMFYRDEKETKEPTRLPNVNIKRLRLIISADFRIIAQKPTVLDIPSFEGDLDTTADDLVEYYSEQVLKKVPGMITKTEVFGANVVDTGLVTYGTYFMQVGAGGVAAGLGAGIGVAVVVGADGLLGAIQAGKESRGGDGYKPGDFVRGLGYTIVKTTKSAGEKRRAKKDGKGAEDHLGDFAVGTGK
eukprot:scaffold32689_cov46-Attheya_sp.AAC.4